MLISSVREKVGIKTDEPSVTEDTMDYLNCYICNSNTKLRNSLRIRTKTKYSGVGVHEIIQSFLKASHVLRFGRNDIVCERCYQKINQYDLACRMADEIQQDITNALYSTEQEYLNEEPIEYLEDAPSDKNTCQKDFEGFALFLDRLIFFTVTKD